MFYPELNEKLIKNDMNNAELKEFTDQFLKFLDNHTPPKTKHIRANISSFMTKFKGEKTMHRCKLK